MPLLRAFLRAPRKQAKNTTRINPIKAHRAYVSQSYSFEDFDRLSISGVYDLTVMVGEDYSVELSGPALEMERVEASVNGGVLSLDQRDRRRGERRHRQKGIDCTITLPALNGLDVSGVVDGMIDGINADRLDIDISGVGDVSLAGKCGTLTADVSGVGELDAEDLKCRIVDIDVSGVGEASVFASDSIDAQVSGMGDINVYGSPKNVKKRGGMFADISIKH